MLKNFKIPIHIEFISTLRVMTRTALNHFDGRIAAVRNKTISLELESHSIGETVEQEISLS